MLSDEDTRVSRYQGMQQEMIQVAAQLGAEAAYIEPEILKIDRATIDRFVAQEPRLKVFALPRRHPAAARAHQVRRRREAAGDRRGRSPAVRRTSTASSRTPISPIPSVTLSDGKTVKLDSAAFSVLPAVPNREDRQKVMSAFFGALGKFRGTFGATLNSQIQSDIFVARARDYTTSLEAALDGPNIPTSVYTRLVDGVNKHLPTFHRYLKLRQKMMGVSELHYYDLYAPLVASADLTYTPEEAQKHVLGGPQAARPRLHQRRHPRLQRALDRSAAQRRQALRRLLERRRLRRPPVHAAQLQRQVQRRQHAGARARPHDAELLLEQGAAVRDRVLPDLRRRGRVDVQRSAAHRLHAQEHQGRCDEAVAARQLSRGDQVHRVPADPVRRIRAARRTRWPRRASRSPARRSTSSTPT